MSHEETAISVLRRELEDILISEDECWQVNDVDPARLLHYAYDEIGSDTSGARLSSLESTHAIRMVKANRASRYVVMAPVRTQKMSEGEFPAIMGQLSKLRSYLSDHEQLEVLALVVCPPGTCDDRRWRGFARQLEQNEAIARVFVWLPPMVQAAWRDSAREFLTRVYLTDTSTLAQHAQDLAPLEGVLAQGALSSEERDRWRKILTVPGVGAKERASSLVDALAVLEETNHGA
jgi:hypothetical protein